MTTLHVKYSKIKKKSFGFTTYCLTLKSRRHKIVLAHFSDCSSTHTDSSSSRTNSKCPNIEQDGFHSVCSDNDRIISFTAVFDHLLLHTRHASVDQSVRELFNKLNQLNNCLSSRDIEYISEIYSQQKCELPTINMGLGSCLKKCVPFGLTLTGSGARFEDCYSYFRQWFGKLSNSIWLHYPSLL